MSNEHPDRTLVWEWTLTLYISHGFTRGTPPLTHSKGNRGSVWRKNIQVMHSGLASAQVQLWYTTGTPLAARHQRGMDQWGKLARKGKRKAGIAAARHHWRPLSDVRPGGALLVWEWAFTSPMGTPEASRH